MSKKEQVAIRLPPAAVDMIEELVGSPLGTNPAEVGRALIIDQLEALAAKGLVKWRVSKPEIKPSAPAPQRASANTRRNRRKGAD